jgi:tRNA threonylcarbamoyladenosine biosynthesis protein TsaB
MDTANENVVLGLWDQEKSVWVHKEEFLGGRELNALIVKRLDKVLSYSQEHQSTLKGIIVAAGPGSFTGLRIGMSVANTLAYTLDVPIVAPAETKSAEDLCQNGLKMLKSRGATFDEAVVPHYGAEPHITSPKK